jgi:hypothetical protein
MMGFLPELFDKVIVLKDGTLCDVVSKKKKTTVSKRYVNKATCKLGERSDLTGCTPASGEQGTKKPASIPIHEAAKKTLNTFNAALLNVHNHKIIHQIKAGVDRVREIEDKTHEKIKEKYGEKTAVVIMHGIALVLNATKELVKMKLNIPDCDICPDIEELPGFKLLLAVPTAVISEAVLRLSQGLKRKDFEGLVEKGWVTLESGTHVFIDDKTGNVTAGPAKLENKPINHLPDSNENKPSEKKSGQISSVGGIKQHYSNWRPSRSSRDAMDFYSRSSYDINSHLRFPDKEADEEDLVDINEATSLLKKAIDSSPPLKSPVVVYRVLAMDSTESKKAEESFKPGSIVEDKAFMSTTPTKKSIAEVEGITIQINVPAGTKAAYIPNEFDELVLAPGTKLKIVSRKGSEIKAEVVRGN